MLKHSQWIWEFARNRWHKVTGVRHVRRAEAQGFVAVACVEMLETRDLLAAASAGFQIPANPDPLRSLGPQSTLVVQVDLKLDASWDPADYREYENSEIRLAYSQVNDFYTRQSFGKLTFPDELLTIVPETIELPYTLRQMETASNGPDQIVKVVNTKLRALGYATKDYQHLTIIHPYLEGKSFEYAGLGMTPGHLVLLNEILDSEVWAHELGHNAGVPHTGVFEAKDPHQVIADPKQMTFREDWTGIDIMDANELVGMDEPGRNGDFFAIRKAQLGWLDLGTNVVNVTNSGRFQLFATDDGTEQDDRVYALRIRRNATQEYWLEYRGSFNENPLDDGVTVTLRNYSGDKKGAGKNLGLLDMTPNSRTASGEYDFQDAALPVGQTFDDLVPKIHFTPVATSFANGAHSIDVIVTIGDDPTNHAPTATITVDDSSPAYNQEVRFAATVQDADGDHLTYSWDFGDGPTNRGTLTPTWQWFNSGDNVVRLTVNDGRGGVSEFVKILTVGDSPALDVTPLKEHDYIPTRMVQYEHRDVSVASDGQNRSVVAWISYATEKKQSFGTIVAQRMEGTEPVGTPIIVGKAATNSLQLDVAMAQNGEFVVSWTGAQTTGGAQSVFVRKFNAAGVAQGAAIEVISNSSDPLSVPDVAITPDASRFVVAWSQNDTPQFRVFNGNGAAVTGVQTVQLASGTKFIGGSAGVAMNSGGEFVIAWGEDYPWDGTYDWQYGAAVVVAQRFHRDGTSNVSARVVSDHGSKFPSKIAIAFAPDGGYSIVYGRRESSLYDNWASPAVLVTVKSDGTKQEPIRVEWQAYNPALTIDATGRRIVAFTSSARSANDEPQLQTRVFSEAGESLGTTSLDTWARSSEVAYLDDLSSFVIVAGDKIGPSMTYRILPVIRFFGVADPDSVVPVSDFVSTPMNQPVSVNVTRNDKSSVPGPLKTSLVVSHRSGIESQAVPNFGTATINQNKTPNDPSDDLLVYTPAAGFRGIVEIPYRVTNSLGADAIGILRVEVGTESVTPVPTIAIADSFTLKEDLKFNASGNGVLKNDVLVNRGKLTVELLTGPSHGTLTLNANGSFIYQPGANFSGVDSFTYRALNGEAYSQPTTVTLNVTPIADKPTLTIPKVVSGSVGSDIALAITANLVDTDGSETLTIKLSGLPATVTLNRGQKQADGSWQLEFQDLVGLKLRASKAGNFTLKVTSLSTESAGALQASVLSSASIKIT